MAVHFPLSLPLAARHAKLPIDGISLERDACLAAVELTKLCRDQTVISNSESNLHKELIHLCRGLKDR
jgi:hypothetical protein